MDKNLYYEEVGKNYRFFLSWRYAVFAAYFVLLWGAYDLALKSIKISNQITGMLLIFASLISIFLWFADCRTRDIYRKLTETGNEIEKEESGVFSTLSQLKLNHFSFFSQSFSINCISFLSFIILFSFGYILMTSDFYFIESENLFNQIVKNISTINLLLGFNIPSFLAIILLGYREISNRKCLDKK